MLNKSCKNIVLYYKGAPSYDTIGELIVSLKNKMKENYEQYVNYKKLLTLMIESLENVVRYMNSIPLLDKLKEKYPAEFILCNETQAYVVETANIIQNTDIKVLKEKFDRLNKMNADEIKDLYKATITDGKFSEHGGAGLGIIEMAKIADDQIKYEFSTIDDTFSYFILRLMIKQA